MASLLNLIIILVLITLDTTKAGITRGVEIQMPPGQYVLALQRNTVAVTVTGGDDPVFYLNDTRLSNIIHLESALDKLKSDLELKTRQAQIMVVLRLDGSVTTRLQQKLINMVISKGMACALANDPL